MPYTCKVAIATFPIYRPLSCLFPVCRRPETHTVELVRRRRFRSSVWCSSAGRMSSVTVCVRFRPLSHKERKANGDKDEREEDVIFSFDRVFYEDAEQSDVYNFLAVPIVADAINGINGTIITYGQTGAGKTYSVEGPSILHCNKQKTGLVQRVVDELFQSLRSSESMAMWSVKLSMVEIYLEKVRDLLDLSKDNLQIKESKTQGIYISGATEVSIMNSSDALECLSEGIANRAVGETLQQGSTSDERLRGGKIILVDLAGSEKVEKTGAEGRVLDEAKTINKSLSALGNVINALTATGKPNHVPYRDSKLTRILQDALVGVKKISRVSELLGWQFKSGIAVLLFPQCLKCTRKTKLIKTPLKSTVEADSAKTASKSTSTSPEVDSVNKPIRDSHEQNDLRDRILNKIKVCSQLRLSLKEEDVDLLEELFVQEGIIFDPEYSVADIDSACQDAASQEISLLTQAVEELKETVEELTDENERLRGELELAQEAAAAAARADGALFGFVPAAAISSLLRPFGFVPD
uniref:Kinesin-like protein n=1 Tax=Leersia perrieri TaxID=77586 RepID=A0A0D9X3V1_9ORYZ